jgi:hypothetical protein
MPLLRYAFALALRAVLGVVGLALTVYGLIYVCGSAYILSQISDSQPAGGLPEGASQAASALSQLGGTEAAAASHPPLGFLVQHFGLYGGIAAIGVFLVVVAIRGAAARIRAGLPSDDEGVGKTPLSRALSGAVYGAGFLFGAFSLAVSIGPGTQMAMLVATGVTVDARVLGFEPSTEPRVYLMRYTFQTPDGRTITDTMPTEPTDTPPSPNLMKTVEVTYMRNDPSQHAVTRYYSHSAFVFFIVTRLGIVLVGLWGVLKNFAPMPKAPEAGGPMDQPRRPSDPPARLRPSPAAGRTSFGRRGA